MVRPTAYWGFIVLGIATTLLGPALLPILSDFHMSPVSTGALFFASSLGYVVAVLTGGPAGDHWSRGLLLRTGALILCIGLGCLALAPVWILVAACLCVISIGSGIVDSGFNALMIDIAPPEGHAREQSLLHASFGVGALLGPLLIGGFLALHMGWRGAYAVDCVGALLLFFFLLRAPVPPRPRGGEAVSFHTVLRLASTPFILLLGLMLGVYVGAEILLGDWSAAYMQNIHHLTKVEAATSVGLYWGGLAAGRLLSALATRWLSGRALLAISCIFSLAACALLVAAPNALVALPALALCGLGYAAVFPLVMAVAGEVYPEAAGSIAGLLLAAGSVFGAVVPWIGGVLVQVSDARAALALSLPADVVMVIIALVLLRYRPSHARLPESGFEALV
jgi:fucose permease